MKTARPHPPTLQQRNDAKNALMKKFPNLPDRFISWALEVAQVNNHNLFILSVHLL